MNNPDTNKRHPDWRSQVTHDLYMQKIAGGHLENGCRLCEAPTLVEFDHWRIIPNNFPYDAVASKHEMIIPKRHTSGDDISAEEFGELTALKHSTLNEHYKFIMESLPSQKSIPEHLHYHLVVPKQVDTFTVSENSA